MLIRYKVANFMSIDESVELSMIASPEKIHLEHVVKPPARKSFRILRTAAIYGANSSGKSSIIKSLSFFKDIIVNKEIELENIPKFKLNKANLKKPVIFEIEFYHSKQVYRYLLEIDNVIIKEELYTYDSKFNESMLFKRELNPKTDNYLTQFGISFPNETERQFTEFLSRGTPKNRSFLQESNLRNSSYFSNPFKWFTQNLIIISPESGYRDLEYKVLSDEKFRKFYSDYLSSLDTGIRNIEAKFIDPAVEELEKVLPKDQRQDLDVALLSRGKRFTYFKSKLGEKQIKVKTHRTDSEGHKVEFGLDEESDGTNRLMDLLPIFYEEEGRGNMTYIIDEIDRSLHPLIVKRLVEDQVNLPSHNLNQLIFSTHETYLLDLNILRRDEIWFVEKGKDNSTSTYSLYDFLPRYDKDIKKDYLLGKFGAIPFIGSSNFLDQIKNTEKDT